MIQFLKSLPSEKILWAFNNNTIEYRDSVITNPTHSDIDCGLFSVRIYPDPQGNFTFNFVEYLRKVIVEDNFSDTLSTHITASPDSLVYDGTLGVYLELSASITVSNESAVSDPLELPLKFISGVLQVEDFKKGEVPQNGFFLLMPIKSRRNNHHRK